MAWVRVLKIISITGFVIVTLAIVSLVLLISSGGLSTDLPRIISLCFFIVLQLTGYILAFIVSRGGTEVPEGRRRIILNSALVILLIALVLNFIELIALGVDSEDVAEKLDRHVSTDVKGKLYYMFVFLSVPVAMVELVCILMILIYAVTYGLRVPCRTDPAHYTKPAKVRFSIQN